MNLSKAWTSLDEGDELEAKVRGEYEGIACLPHGSSAAAARGRRGPCMESAERALRGPRPPQGVGAGPQDQRGPDKRVGAAAGARVPERAEVQAPEGRNAGAAERQRHPAILQGARHRKAGQEQVPDRRWVARRRRPRCPLSEQPALPCATDLKLDVQKLTSELEDERNAQTALRTSLDSLKAKLSQSNRSLDESDAGLSELEAQRSEQDRGAATSASGDLCWRMGPRADASGAAVSAELAKERSRTRDLRDQLRASSVDAHLSKENLKLAEAKLRNGHGRILGEAADVPAVPFPAPVRRPGGT